MTEISQNNSGQEVASIINDALEAAGSSVTVGNESGGSVSGKLNGVFGDSVLNSSQSGSEWSQAVAEGFEGTGGGGTTFKFLQIGDPHGIVPWKDYAGRNLGRTLVEAKSLLDDADNQLEFVFVMGDISGYNNDQTKKLPDSFVSALVNLGNKLLLLPGNHDAYDNEWGTGTSKNQAATTAYLKGKMSGSGVTWGDTGNVASYWHKDYPLSATSKLRVISIDQYEYDRVRKPETYFTMYHQSQIDWLIARIDELTADDYFIIALHEPPVQSPQTPDSYAVGLRASTDNPESEKLFVSENLVDFGNRFSGGAAREPQLSLLPRIVKAYKDKQSLSMTYNSYGGNSNSPDVTISKDWTNAAGATFLCYLCGHMHGDYTYWLPDESELVYKGESGQDWSDQLMIGITAADADILHQNQDDLGGRHADNSMPSTTNTDFWRINMITLDFDREKILITRYGSKNTEAGRVRDHVEFSFNKS